MKTKNLIQDKKSLYTLHNRNGSSKELCNEFYMSVQSDYAGGINDNDAIAFAAEIKKRYDAYDNLLNAISEIKNQFPGIDEENLTTLEMNILEILNRINN